MYEELRKEVNWEHKYPEGEVLHASGFDNLGTKPVATENRVPN